MLFSIPVKSFADLRPTAAAFRLGFNRWNNDGCGERDLFAVVNRWFRADFVSHLARYQYARTFLVVRVCGRYYWEYTRQGKTVLGKW